MRGTPVTVTLGPMPKLASLLATAIFLCALPAAALAADVPVSTAPVVDGQVNTATYDSSGRAYLGGDFAHVGPRLGSGLRLTNTSDTPGSLPDINGSVLAAVSDSAGGHFIGGTFTSVGGVPRLRLAHLFADGTLDANWNPGANNTVRALALSSDGASLYVGGDFNGANSIAGATRGRLAKLSAATGAPDPTWRPSATSAVRALVATASDVYAGGSFAGVFTSSSNSAPMLAKLQAGGAGNPDATWGGASGGGQGVFALALSGPDLYVGGNFVQIAGASRDNLAKVASGGTGAADPTWKPDFVGNDVRALLLSGPDLFVAGQYFQVGGQNRAGLAKLSTTGAGNADATWNPALGFPESFDALALSGGDLVAGGSFDELGASTDKPNLALVSTTGAGTVRGWRPNPNGTVKALAISGPGIFAGGDFTSAGPDNKLRGSLIRLNPNGSLDEAWDPQVEGLVNALSLTGDELIIGGGFFRVHGATKFGLAKLSTAGSGARITEWATQPSQQVLSLARVGNDLFVGGQFSGPNSIDNQNRAGIAKVAATGTGAVDPTWNPGAFGEVDALQASGGDVYAGGTFLDMGGQPRSRIAKLAATGAGNADAAWDPSAGSTVNALLLSGSNLYAGGLFGGIGGEASARIAKLSTTGTGSADQDWTDQPKPNAGVFALAQSGNDLYAGGAFSTFGVPRSRLARLSAATGAVDPAFEPGPINNGGIVSALAATPSRVLVGGSFNGFGPLSTSGFAIFDLTTPTVGLTSPFDGARYRQGQGVDAAYTCDDPDGSADSISCTGTVPSGSPIDTATGGAKTFTATATDAGSRSVSSTANYFVDGSAPAISISIPPDGSVIVPGTRIPVTFSCTDDDGPADIASCNGTSPNGTQLDTSSPGDHVFTVTSTDLVGNTSTKSVTYNVPAGSSAPVAPVLSALKIKPAKFKARKGARVSFRLSKAATVTFTVKGKTKGKFTRKAKRGANRFTFRGKVGRKTLKPGKYKLSARAKDAGGLQSKTLTKAFRVLKP